MTLILLLLCFCLQWDGENETFAGYDIERIRHLGKEKALDTDFLDFMTINHNCTSSLLRRSEEKEVFGEGCNPFKEVKLDFVPDKSTCRINPVSNYLTFRFISGSVSILRNTLGKKELKNHKLLGTFSFFGVTNGGREKSKSEKHVT